MLGTGSTISSLTLLRLVVEADFLSLPPVGSPPANWFEPGEMGDKSTDEASVSVVSLDACEDARERVDTLWSESSAEEGLRAGMEGTVFRLEMSGASYESWFVVEMRAIGREILLRSMEPLFLTLWLRVGEVDSFGSSVRFMRFVMARARDILLN